MIEASKAAEITEQAYIKKRDNLYQNINNEIVKAANNGRSDCDIDYSIYFDDTIKHALHTAGYHIRYIWSGCGGFYNISWSDNKC